MTSPPAARVEVGRSDRGGAAMIYTVGHRDNYLRAIAESQDGYIEKTGRQSGYNGGCAFRTIEDARRALDEFNQPSWCVWGLDAKWNWDTEPSLSGAWWHDLLVTSRIVPIPQELENSNDSSAHHQPRRCEMKKIPSLFKRDYEGPRQVYDELVDGTEWVQAGEGIATEKVDGTCCLVRNGKLYKRYDAKHGKNPPAEWEPAEDEPDENTGHWPGWLPVGEGPEDKWHREAFGSTPIFYNGTYELIGPKVQDNPYDLAQHHLVEHGSIVIDNVPRTFEALRDWLFDNDAIEGIVWHHPDGRMVKIKRRDFGLPWPVKHAK